MVYTGQRSRACACCKIRKIKCDEARPACKNCVNARLACHGYPNKVDIMFVDQTGTVKSKFQASKSKLARIQAPAGSSTSGSNVPLQVASKPNYDFWDGRISVFEAVNDKSIASESQAIVHYLRILGPTLDTGEVLRRYVDSSTPTVISKAPLQPAVVEATHALALGTLIRSSSTLEAQRAATIQYSRALRAIGLALSNPKESRTDQTLYSVKMLEMLETFISSGDDPSNPRWFRHCAGTVALTRYRGRHNFSTPYARNLFHSTRISMLAACLHFSDPLPSFPGKDGWGIILGPDPGYTLIPLACDLADMRSRSRVLFESSDLDANPHKVQSMALEASDIDRRLELWQASLPAHWRPHRVTITSPPGTRVEELPAWGNRADIYYNLWTMLHSLLHRALRVYALCGRLRCLHWLARKNLGKISKASLQLDKAFEEIQLYIDDICAMIPAATGDVPPSTPLPEGYNLENVSCRSMYSLCFNLALIGRVEWLSNIQRRWVHGRLDIMAVKFGVTAGRQLASWTSCVIFQAPQDPPLEEQRQIFMKTISFHLKNEDEEYENSKVTPVTS